MKRADAYWVYFYLDELRKVRNLIIENRADKKAVQILHEASVIPMVALSRLGVDPTFSRTFFYLGGALTYDTVMQFLEV